MINRTIISELDSWRKSEHRKPLILRGPRQVGKTTAVNQFGKTFNNYLYLNLDEPDQSAIFNLNLPIDELLNMLFAKSGVKKSSGDTLIFIDEIQNSPKAISMLRYFYEKRPDIYVIAAGSLLENLVDVNVSFPVGRVQYMAMRPCSFVEFLGAIGKDSLVSLLDRYEQLEPFHPELRNLFHRYTIVGGMPEIVNEYAKSEDIWALDDIYDSLLQSYQDDVEKYVKGSKLKDVVRFIINTGWAKAGETITLTRFNNSDYNSREIGEAFRLLEKAMLLELCYPTTSTQMPAIGEEKRMPKLLWFDTGIVNHSAGIKKELVDKNDILDVWRGKISEHIVAQELLALNNRIAQKRCFWTKGKGQASAEVDFVLTYNSQLYPIEVKSGHNAHLRSLHSFLDNSEQNIAIRIWSEPFSVNDLETVNGKQFRLLNIPFYLINQIGKIIDRYSI